MKNRKKIFNGILFAVYLLTALLYPRWYAAMNRYISRTFELWPIMLAQTGISAGRMLILLMRAQLVERTFSIGNLVYYLLLAVVSVVLLLISYVSSFSTPAYVAALTTECIFEVVLFLYYTRRREQA